MYKDGRAEGVHEGKSRVKEGTQWREHSIRKLMRGVKPQIFPGLNDSHDQVNGGASLAADDARLF